MSSKEIRVLAHLDVVVPVVVQVEDPVDLRVCADVDIVRVGDALAQGLSRVLLHLDVVELPARKWKRNGQIMQSSGLRPFSRFSCLLSCGFHLPLLVLAWTNLSCVFAIL